MDILQELSYKLILPIDFESQIYTEKLTSKILSAGLIISCILGYSLQSLKWMIYCFLASYFITLIAILPSYPIYNKKKPQWVSTKIT